MKFLLLMVLSLSTISTQLRAGEETTDVVRTQLCDYWKYDFNSHSYTCNYTGPHVSLVEASRFENTINALTKKIDELEKRIEKLEMK